MGYIKRCLNCGKEIPRKRKRDLVKRFCDRSCSSKFLFSAPQVRCRMCGDLMSSAKGRVFCSKKCSNGFRSSKYTKICPTCHKPFILKNRAYERRGAGVYCSIKCGAVAHKRHNLDEKYFDKIDCERKAYWLGFLFADGYQSGKEVRVRLKSSDKPHLEEFKKDVCATVPIRARINWSPLYKFGKVDISELVLYSPTMCRSLADLGCVRAKSLILEYPRRVPKRLERHFIRGYFDGDGCISVTKSGKRVHFYSGSLAMVAGIEEFFLRKGITLNRGISNQRFLSTARRATILKVYKVMYRAATIFLDRKKNKFDKFLNRSNHEVPCKQS